MYTASSDLSFELSRLCFNQIMYLDEHFEAELASSLPAIASSLIIFLLSVDMMAINSLAPLSLQLDYPALPRLKLVLSVAFVHHSNYLVFKLILKQT